MWPFRTKLRSRAGAAMIMALLFLLFCTTIGMITLSSASANAGKLSRMRVEQQSYLAVRSAVKAFEEIVVNMEFSGTYTYRHAKWYETIENSAGVSTEVLHEPDKRYYAQKGVFNPAEFQSMVGEKVKNLFFYVLGDTEAAAPADENPYTFNLKLKTGIADYPTVDAAMEFSVIETDRYSITVTLTDETDGGNPMKLYFSAKLSDSSSVGIPPHGTEIPEGDNIRAEIDETLDYTYSITWELSVLERGGGSNDP